MIIVTPILSNENGINITGYRDKAIKDEVQFTEVISGKQIENQGSEDLSEALSNQSGIELKAPQRGQRGVSILFQGMNPEHVLILVDGVRVGGRFSGSIDLTRIKVDNIERIEVIRGSSSALYGSNGMAGVINIITKRSKKKQEASFSSSYGSGRKLHYDSGSIVNSKASIGKSSDFYDTYFTMGWHKSDGYDITPDATWGARSGKYASQSEYYDPYSKIVTDEVKYIIHRYKIPHDKPLESSTGNPYLDVNFSNQSNFYLKKNLILKLKINYTELKQEGVFAQLPRRVYDRRNNTEDFMSSVGLRHKTKKIETNFFVNNYRFFDIYEQDQRQSDEMDKQETTSDESIETKLKIDYNHKNHKVSFGNDVMYEKLASPNVALKCKRTFPYICPGEKTLEKLKMNGVVSRNIYSSYIQDSFIVRNFPLINFTYGVRYESWNGKSKALPKFSARYDVSHKTKFRFGVGDGFRIPSFKDLYYNFQNPSAGYQVSGNPRLKPEMVKTYNGSFETNITRKLWIFGNLFHNNLTNLIEYSSRNNVLSIERGNLSTFQAKNIGKVFIQGAELQINYKIASNTSIKLGYTHMETLNKKANLPLEGRPHHKASIGISAETKKTKVGFNLSGTITSKQPYLCQVNSLACDGRYFFDLNPIRKNFTSLQKLFCEVNNLVWCSDKPVYGVKNRNPYNLINLRIYKKLDEYFEVFIGAKNLLDEYNVVYNSIRPKLYYVGLKGKF